jgi:hypothetical protein
MFSSSLAGLQHDGNVETFFFSMMLVSRIDVVVVEIVLVDEPSFQQQQTQWLEILSNLTWTNTISRKASYIEDGVAATVVWTMQPFFFRLVSKM